MKAYIAPFSLLCRSMLGKLLLLIGVLAVLESGLFYVTLDRELDALLAGVGEYTTLPAESLFARSHAAWMFTAAAFILTALLCLFGCEFGSKVGYTLCRLRIREKAFFLTQALFGALCYLLLWAAQAGILYVLSAYMMTQAGDAFTSSQTVFLAFYRSDFLHVLLPIEDVWLWIRNILIAAALGVTSAVFSFRQRRGKFGGEAAAAFLVTLIWFIRPLGDYATDVLLILSLLAVCAEAIWTVFRVEAGYETT